jgi:hypothetical protein
VPLLYADTTEASAVLELHAGALERRLGFYRKAIGLALKQELERLEPGRGKMQEHTRSFLASPTTVKIGVFGLPYARARDRGAFIVASGVNLGDSPQARAYRTRHPFKEGGPRALRLEDGSLRRWVRTEGTHYFERAVALAPLTVSKTYDAIFSNLNAPTAEHA